MNYFVRILLINLCMVLVLQVDAQTTSNSKTKKADKAFALEQYNKAAELYKKAYSKTKNRALKAEITFKQAECYRLSGNTKRAESYYKRAVKTKYPSFVNLLSTRSKKLMSSSIINILAFSGNNTSVDS